MLSVLCRIYLPPSFFWLSLARYLLTLQHIQTDPAKTVDVRVVDLGQEADLGRHHRIVLGQEQLELELAPCIRYTC